MVPDVSRYAPYRYRLWLIHEPYLGNQVRFWVEQFCIALRVIYFNKIRKESRAVLKVSVGTPYGRTLATHSPLLLFSNCVFETEYCPSLLQLTS